MYLRYGHGLGGQEGADDQLLDEHSEDRHGEEDFGFQNSIQKKTKAGILDLLLMPLDNLWVSPFLYLSHTTPLNASLQHWTSSDLNLAITSRDRLAHEGERVFLTSSLGLAATVL